MLQVLTLQQRAAMRHQPALAEEWLCKRSTRLASWEVPATPLLWSASEAATGPLGRPEEPAGTLWPLLRAFRLLMSCGGGGHLGPEAKLKAGA